MRITRAKDPSRRGTTWSALALAATAAAAVTAGSSGAQPTHTENWSASRAITATTTASAAEARDAVPTDFAEFAGYAPTVVDGHLANPNGDCSSPIALPGEFDSACKAHDFGYDLLRYAHSRGTELGPWARRALDTQLDRRMHSACEDRSSFGSRTYCFSMADIAVAAVNGNSWRQSYLTPVTESGFGYSSGYGAVGTLAVSALGFAAVRSRLFTRIVRPAKAVAA